jgi:protein TonB
LKHKNNFKNSFLYSAGFHIGFSALLIGIILWDRREVPTEIELEVFEKPQVIQKTPQINTRPPTKSLAKPKGRAVFGVSRQSQTSDESQVTLKQGNTLAKTHDNLKLNPDDPDFIESPVDDYLVNEMPRLITESRIPYPPEAKKKGIEGPVVIEIIVDSKGNVKAPKLISGPGSGLNEAALQAILKFKFTPAKIGEKLVAVQIRYTYRFILER